MSASREIVLIKADVQPIRKREVFWVLSKSQIEHIVKEIKVVPVPFSARYLHGVAAWQGLALPVVSLERYFGFKPLQRGSAKRYTIIKTPTYAAPNTLSRLLLDVTHDLRIRPSITDCVAIKLAREDLAARGLLGVYEWGEDALLLLPDLVAIASGGGTARS